MKLTIPTEERAAFLEDLRALNKVVNQKTTMPILSMLLLQAEGSILRMTAFDLEVALTCNTKVDTAKKGELCVAAAAFLKTVEKLADGPITLEANEKTLIIKCAGFKSSLGTMGADNYPPLFAEKGMTSIGDVPPAALISALRAVDYAQSEDASQRLFMRGVNFRSKKTGTTAAALSGQRLAVTKTAIDFKFPKGTTEFILPTRAASLVLGLLKSAGSAEVGLLIGNAYLVIEMESQRFMARLIDSEFPAYENAIPAPQPNVLEFKHAELSAALDRVLLYVGEMSMVVLSGAPGQEMVLAAAENVKSLGDASEPVASSEIVEAFTVRANGGQIQEALRHIDSENVVVEVGGSQAIALYSPGRRDEQIHVSSIFPEA
jgi:DNA polymerase-3 subunit beta